ncbi:hypothetical protein AMJ82_10165 [candidate division TA06 bacterium SM23_40]|uniref:Uncharacterized protein n=1 Tax=candidate division TA06 bacterium SM23_40 TaxID=1703774 RepID=A0A0S8G699_UNCT6|nr:MAG: hypothetical protein AMJ82_10165 [candidate division TA06 bacterium SM23_40]
MRAARPATTLATLITPGASAFLAAGQVPPLRKRVGGFVAATVIASARIFNDVCRGETDWLGRRTRMRSLARDTRAARPALIWLSNEQTKEHYCGNH